MKNITPSISIVLFVFSFLGFIDAAHAQCTLPYQLANGQVADATQVMANYNALVQCTNNISPAGPNNAIQYKSGGGSFGSVGPLGDGQLVIGSTGGIPQAQTITAGSGIKIANGPGSITISTSASGTGLYGQVMSATPTSAGTGLTNWLNQGGATVSDTAVGLCINAPSSNGTHISGRYMSAPATPYTIRV